MKKILLFTTPVIVLILSSRLFGAEKFANENIPDQQGSASAAVLNSTPDPDLLFDRGGERPAVTCNPKLNYDSFCQELTGGCKKRTNSRPDCYPVFDVADKRCGSLELQGRVFPYTERMFNNFTHDPEMQKLCCGDNQPCQVRFSSTRLRILRSRPSDFGAVARYIPSQHVVELSDKELLPNFVEQGVETAVLHELGHSCQYARRTIDILRINLKDCNNIDAFQNDFKELFGDGITNCVIETLDKEKSGRMPNACFAKWVMEAFANSVFVTKKTDPYYFISDCSEMMDENHAKSTVYFPCLGDVPAVQKNLCPSF